MRVKFYFYPKAGHLRFLGTGAEYASVQPRGLEAVRLMHSINLFTKSTKRKYKIFYIFFKNV
jgi:hypothetical protein